MPWINDGESQYSYLLDIDVLKKITATDRMKSRLERLEKSRFFKMELGGMEIIVSRTGYTGEEIGYELFLHPSMAPDLWNLILDAGKEDGAKPVGPGARDSLRIEAGLPLYGHELSEPFDLSPFEAGFGPYVKFHKPYFIGRDALFERMKSMKMAVVRFKMSSKGVPIVKQNDPVVSSRTQRIIGAVTSRAVNQEGIQVGMACVDKKFSREGTGIGVIPGVHGGRERSRPLQDLVPGDKFCFLRMLLCSVVFPKGSSGCFSRGHTGYFLNC
ncbi:Aminomethyltransferase [subsurface metagenome]